MSQIHAGIRETHILGSETQVRVLRSDDRDERDWLADAPVCQSLNDYRIAHCGIMHAIPPFIPNAMKATGQKPWTISWVRYQERVNHEGREEHEGKTVKGRIV